jgi:hypothetical protein
VFENENVRSHGETKEIPSIGIIIQSSKNFHNVLKQKNESRKNSRRRKTSWKPRKKVEAFPKEKVIKVFGKTFEI